MNQLETAISLIKNVSAEEFAARLPGPFLLQMYTSQVRSAEVSTDPQSKTPPNITLRSIPPGESQRYNLQLKEMLKKPEDLLQHFELFTIEKTKRNVFTQGITIGRTNNNDIVLQDATISKFHAWIRYPGPMRNNFMLYDAKSHYGTLLNYQQVDEVGAPLLPGSRLRFGNVTMVFLLSDGLYQWTKEALSVL